MTHGRSIAVSVALKEAPDKLLSSSTLLSRVKQAVVTFTASDRIPVCTSGLRGAAYWLKHEVTAAASPDVDLISLLVKAMKHSSNDVKQLAAQIVILLARTGTQQQTETSTPGMCSCSSSLEVKREYYQNCCVLGCVTQCSQSAAHLYEQVQQIWVCHIGTVTLCVEAVA